MDLKFHLKVLCNILYDCNMKFFDYWPRIHEVEGQTLVEQNYCSGVGGSDSSILTTAASLRRCYRHYVTTYFHCTIAAHGILFVFMIKLSRIVCTWGKSTSGPVVVKLCWYFQQALSVPGDRTYRNSEEDFSISH